MIKDFDDWCYMANNSIEENCLINNRIFRKGISKKEFLENLDDYIELLKDKQEKKYEI